MDSLYLKEELTAALLVALQAWQKEGKKNRRTIEIKIGADPDKTSVWCFDREVMEGSFITGMEQLLDLDLAANKRKRLEEELAKMNDK